MNSTNPIEELRRIFDYQHGLFEQHPNTPLAERINRLQRLKQLLLVNRKPLIAAICKDFGSRAKEETEIGEMMTLLTEINHCIKKLPKWIKPSSRRLDLVFLPGKGAVLYQPKGVVGVISPWNYPILLSLAPVINAFAAGNRVMLKVSEHTPKTSALLSTLINEIFDEGEFRVINGGTGISIAFSQLPFDHIIFTGSTQTGRAVMSAAAKNLTPVTLELGGKSPAIIANDIPMAEAATLIGFGKTYSSGQSCIAPDYVLCPNTRMDEFVSHFGEFIAKRYLTLAHNSDYTSIINDTQYQRLTGYLDDAADKGAKIIVFNPADEVLHQDRKMAPTLLLNTTDEMQISHDEIFGPLLPVIGYDSLEDAIEYVQKRPRPLTLYYLGHDASQQQQVIEKTISGSIVFNDMLIQATQSRLPFGGTGDSGIGHYHGYEGFLELSHQRSLVKKGKFNSTRFGLPPYGRLIHKLLSRFFVR